MAKKSAQPTWQQRITQFAATVPKKPGYFFVPDIARFMTKNLATPQLAIAYLKDHAALTEKQIIFHRHWQKRLPKQEGAVFGVIAKLEKKEVEILKKIIRLLQW